jgi:hypothetical protein
MTDLHSAVGQGGFASPRNGNEQGKESHFNLFCFDPHGASGTGQECPQPRLNRDYLI